jgi:PPP family 3-phenylpropionic acid transporter
MIAGPAAGQIADRMQALRTVFAVCTISAAAFAFANLTAWTFWSLLAIWIFCSAALAPAVPLADALALAAAEPRRRKKCFEYGWVRGAGSAAFIVGTIISGQAIGPFGLGSTLILQAALLLLAAIWIGGVPNYVSKSKTAASDDHHAKACDGVWELGHIPEFRRVVLVAALVLGSHALHDGFAIIHWTAASIGSTTVSVLWSEQVVAEVAVFLFIGPTLLRWLGPSQALTLSAGAGTIRWTVTAISTDPYVLALIEPLPD